MQRGKVALVRSVGADHVIDYTEEEITTSGQHYDLVLDMGGNRTLAELRRCLTPRGTLVLVGGEGGGRLIGGAMAGRCAPSPCHRSSPRT